MKFAIVFVAILAVALAGPIDDSKNAKIVSADSDNIGTGDYKFSFETSDGTSRQEQGQLTNVGTDDEGIAVTGVVSWVGDDGHQYTLRYTANKDGYYPEGDHLPK